MATVTAVACSVAKVSLLAGGCRDGAQLTCGIADNGDQNETNELLGYISVFHNIVNATNHEFRIEGNEDCRNGQSDESTNDRQ